MPQPSYLDAGDGAATTSNTTLAVPYPTSLNGGDIMVLDVLQRSDGPTKLSTPSGWTEITSKAHTSFPAAKHTAFIKVATGSESGTLSLSLPSVTPNLGTFARIYRISPADVTPEGIGSDAGASTTVSDRTVTTTGPGELAVNLVAITDNVDPTPEFTGQTGGTWAEPVPEYQSAVGDNATLQIQVAPIASAGTINGGSFSKAYTDNWSVLGFALLPGKTPVGMATETDSVFAATAQKSPAGVYAEIGVSPENETVFAVTAVKTPAADTDLYYAINLNNGLVEMLLPEDEAGQILTRVRSGTARRGRPFNLDKIEAGTMEFVLRNDDGLLDPTNLASPYYGLILPLLPSRFMRREAGLTYELFYGPVERWEPEYEQPSFQWMTVASADSFEAFANAPIVSGFSTYTTTLTGTNNDLVFTAVEAGGQGDDLSVEYVVAGVDTVASAATSEPPPVQVLGKIQRPNPLAKPNAVGSTTPAIPIEIKLSGTDITVNVATNGSGVATSTAAEIKALIEADPALSALVTITYPAGENGSGVVTAMAKTHLSGGKWPEELSSVRINRVLDLIGWPADQRAIDEGSYVVAAKGFSIKDDVMALTHMQAVADSELGLLFMSGNDIITFHSGSHRASALRSSVSQASFADDGTGIGFRDPKPSFDKERIVNSVSVSCGYSELPVQTADDLYSQHGIGDKPSGATNIPPKGFGVRAISRSTELAFVEDALAQAQAIVAAFSYPMYRFDEITTEEPEDPDARAEWIESVLRLEISDLVTLRIQPPGTDTRTSYNAFVEQIIDFVAPGLPHKRVLKLTSQSQSVVIPEGGGGGGGGGGEGVLLNIYGRPLILDDPVEGVIDA